VTILVWSAQLFSAYLGKTNSDNSVWWAYVHRWLAAGPFENQPRPIVLAGSQRHIVKLVLERPSLAAA